MLLLPSPQLYAPTISHPVCISRISCKCSLVPWFLWSRRHGLRGLIGLQGAGLIGDRSFPSALQDVLCEGSPGSTIASQVLKDYFSVLRIFVPSSDHGGSCTCGSGVFVKILAIEPTPRFVPLLHSLLERLHLFALPLCFSPGSAFVVSLGKRVGTLLFHSLCM